MLVDGALAIVEHARAAGIARQRAVLGQPLPFFDQNCALGLNRNWPNRLAACPTVAACIGQVEIEPEVAHHSRC